MVELRVACADWWLCVQPPAQLRNPGRVGGPQASHVNCTALPLQGAGQVQFSNPSRSRLTLYALATETHVQLLVLVLHRTMPPCLATLNPLCVFTGAHPSRSTHMQPRARAAVGAGPHAALLLHAGRSLVPHAAAAAPGACCGCMRSAA